MGKYEYSKQEIASNAVRLKRLIRRKAKALNCLELANNHLNNELAIDYDNWMQSLKWLRSYALCLHFKMQGE